MVNKIFVILLFLLGAKNATGQEIKIKEFKHAVNTQFAKLVTGTAFGNVGNFVSISSDAKPFAVAGNIVGKRSIWGFELSGGATEGIFKLFDNEGLNSNFSGEIKYHKLLKTDFSARNAFDVLDIDNQIDEVNNQFSKDSLMIVRQKDLHVLQLDILEVKPKAIEKNNQKGNQINKIDSILASSSITKQIRDSLESKKGILLFEIESSNMNVDINDKKLNKIKSNKDDYFDEEFERRVQKRDKDLSDLKSKRMNIALQEFDITWLSFGLRAKNNDFKLFYPNNSPSAKFSDTSFVSQRFAFSISRYRKSALENKEAYWSAGVYLDYTENFNTLNKVEVEETTPVSGNPQQQIKKTINAYQGDYKEGIFEATLFYDHYRFLGDQYSLLGIHINPSVNYSSGTKKLLTNLYLGVVVPFQDKKEQTSKINVEIFYNRQDIFNYLDQEVRPTSFGIRAILPITALNNKL